MQEFEIYAAGKFIKTGNVLDVRNPFTGEVFAQTYKADESILNEAIEKAREVRPQLAALPSYIRYEILLQISNELKKQKKELALQLCHESGKPLKYAVAEMDRAIQTFLVAAEESKRLPKEYISLDWTPTGEGKEGIIKYFPIGIVAGISPFNFPINLAVHKIAPAIAAGCPIILKPASPTPLSTLSLARIIDGTSLPKGAVSILPMDRTTGNMLVTDERIQLLSFTGSPIVGWEMKRNAGKKKTVLELGGNAGVIVSDKADVKHAVKRCLVGGFAYSGQVCIHAQRIYVQKEVFDIFIGKFISATESMMKGDPELPETDMSVMIDEENAIRVEEWIHEAVLQGAKILTGGTRSNSMVKPTVLTNTTASMKVNCEEVFGPVVVIEPYDKFEEAIDLMNRSRFGLQAGVFTTDIHEADEAFNKLNVGGVIINDVPTFRVDHMPYGGNKDSGQGREGVKYAILDMMEARIMVK